MVLLFDIYTNDRVLSRQFQHELCKYGDTKLVSEPEIFGTNYYVLLAFGGTDVNKLIESLKNASEELSLYREIETERISMLRFSAFRVTECFGEYKNDVREWLESYLNNICLHN